MTINKMAKGGGGENGGHFETHMLSSTPHLVPFVMDRLFAEGTWPFILCICNRRGVVSDGSAEDEASMRRTHLGLRSLRLVLRHDGEIDDFRAVVRALQVAPPRRPDGVRGEVEGCAILRVRIPLFVHGQFFSRE